jgi:hypothetical protein
MKKYNLGIEEATRVILVSRAVRREWSRCSTLTPTRAIQQLTFKISLDSILYESSSSDDDLASDDDEHYRLSAIREELRVDPLHDKSMSTSRASAPSTTKNSNRSFDSEVRKNNARKRQSTQQQSSPRKASKQILRSSSSSIISSSSAAVSSTSRGSTKGTPTIVAGRKRSVDEIGERQHQQQQSSPSDSLAGTPTCRGRSDSISAEVDAKISSTERSLVVTADDNNAKGSGNGVNSNIRAKKTTMRPSNDDDDVSSANTISVPSNNGNTGPAFG